MGLDEARKLIKIDSTYKTKEVSRFANSATVDSISELSDGNTEITYHYSNERKSRWFLSAEEFIKKF